MPMEPGQFMLMLAGETTGIDGTMPAIEMVMVETVCPVQVMMGHFVKIGDGDRQPQQDPERGPDDKARPAATCAAAEIWPESMGE